MPLSSNPVTELFSTLGVSSGRYLHLPKLTLLLAALPFFLCDLPAQVCRISASGLNRNRRVTGSINAECPPSFIHTSPFGNWGVTSNFGQKHDDHQFQGWCHDTLTCDNRGNCRTECRDGWYEWNSCTDASEFRAPNCTLYNDNNCTSQASPLGVNVHGTRTIDLSVRCPVDTNADSISDEGGCADIKFFSNGTNFMSLYELDPGSTDDLIQTLYFPETPVQLACNVFGCPAAQSPWVAPNAFDSPSSPGKIAAEFSMSVNSAIFIDTSRACRAVAPPPDTVSGASFRGTALAPESIASAFGVGLALSTDTARSFPLPVELAGTRVSVIDAASVTRGAPLFHVSPTQVNFLVPAGTAAGAATVMIARTDSVVARGTLRIADAAPSLFSADASGNGVAAATAVRVDSAGRLTPVALFSCTGEPRACSPVPISLDGGAVYVSLYGTGIRGASARIAAVAGATPLEVLYAGPQPQYSGLDQVNVRFPESLRGRGLVEFRVGAGSDVSNAVTLLIQ